MAKFGYRSRRDMEPRPGVRYATTYYLQSPRERQRTQEFIETVIQRVGTLALETPGGAEELDRPLPGFPRTGGRPNYSALDIMTDMLTQMAAGRDIPSGMLGRWNRLFRASGMEIDMVPEQDL